MSCQKSSLKREDFVGVENDTENGQVVLSRSIGWRAGTITGDDEGFAVLLKDKVKGWDDTRMHVPLTGHMALSKIFVVPGISSNRPVRICFTLASG